MNAVRSQFSIHEGNPALPPPFRVVESAIEASSISIRTKEIFEFECREILGKKLFIYRLRDADGPFDVYNKKPLHNQTSNLWI